jgi:hypothetical protein
MNNFAYILLATACIAPASVNAATLLLVDLTTTNQLTLTATSGTSGATESDEDFIGFLLAGFFTSSASLSAGNELALSGNLTSAQNTSGGLPRLFKAESSFGLNVHGYTTEGTSSFVAGELAFSGSATWALDSATYAAALSGPASGSIFFSADEDAQISGASLIGEWERTAATVPLPAGGLLLLTTLAGVAGVRRLKKRTKSF